ncbi:MAG TPA: RidA family protein [Longimicrobiales bacterium]
MFDIINPAALGEPKGWNNGMLAPAGGRILFVAGQTARGGDGVIVDGGIAAQWAQALANVLAVVREAGGDVANIGRMTIFITSRADYLANRSALGPVWRAAMGRHFPAVAVVEVSGLVDDGAVVEIEATAVL